LWARPVDAGIAQLHKSPANRASETNLVIGVFLSDVE
jgi:hypothetical protein